MASSNVSSKTILFKREKEFWYRIPSLLHVPNTDTLLAFAEKRLGPKDENADVLMLRKGTYKKPLKNFEWENVTSVQAARLKDHRSMNPCPVYDKDTNTIFLLFIAVFGNTPENLCHAHNVFYWHMTLFHSAVRKLGQSSLSPVSAAVFAVGQHDGKL
ncbi:sialidase-4-like [Callorhinchus milii]|uniref:sialidase-4-like n=1 Tax=Callorhinchus milii TaxID=7868 RepID=UPI001C3FAEF3|nr:sialidase-4-like [Callorhinchus milii]